jgi:hypothetical protein
MNPNHRTKHRPKLGQTLNNMKNELDPAALYWASFNRFQFRMPGEAVTDCAASGSVDVAVALWAPRIATLTRALYADDPANPWNPTPEKVREELRETGAWDEDELADDAENWKRIVWIAAGNIADEESPDCSPVVGEGGAQ